MIQKLLLHLRAVGPALIVAAVVLGPGSILTSSKVGAQLGYSGLFFLILSSILMIAMVALSTHLGMVHKNGLCEELAHYLGRGYSVFIGLVLFLVIALYQSSNNVAMIAAVELLFGRNQLNLLVADSHSKTLFLLLINGFVTICLYLTTQLYSWIERAMKTLVLVMILAFFVNFFIVVLQPRDYIPAADPVKIDLIPLMAMIGTTFSIAGAFYQAYLVREKGWTFANWRQGITDSVFGISVLSMVTGIILITAVILFHGRQDPVVLNSIEDIASQLEPLFGKGAKVIFSLGIIAGALSSFLVNAVIGGTILSDSLGKGSRVDSNWTKNLTILVLFNGMTIAIISLFGSKEALPVILLAQALTVLGLPALGFALIYLGTRPELTGDRKVPQKILITCFIGFLVACLVALRTALIIYEKITV